MKTTPLNPVLESAIDALKQTDKRKWESLFEDGAELFDDGQPRNLTKFTADALGHERFRSIDRVEDGGLTAIGDFYSDQWGDFKAYFTVTLSTSGKIRRLDIGQAGSRS